MKWIFTEHPASVNETYFQHLRFAGEFGLRMIMGGMACLLHAIFPFMFIKTGSNQLLKMTENFIQRMPSVEDRVHGIYQIIDVKMKACQQDG